MVWIWVLVIVAVIAVALVAVAFTRLVKLRNHTQMAWADIDAQLKRRSDLIPELTEVVKGYASHETSVFSEAAAARAGAAGDDPTARAASEQRVTASVGGLIGVAEAYPDLKAADRFSQLQTELTETENRIALARMVYNDTVQTFNTSIERLPASLIAGPLGFTRRALFDPGAA